MSISATPSSYCEAGPTLTGVIFRPARLARRARPAGVVQARVLVHGGASHGFTHFLADAFEADSGPG